MSAPIDVDRARAETPGTNTVAHFNNAGAALPSRQVLERQIAHLQREATIGGYEAQRETAEELDRVYDEVARLIGSSPSEIALVDSATRAWHLGFHSFDFEPGDRIVTAQAEYATGAISFLQTAAKHGIEIVVVPDDDHGQVDTTALAAVLDERVRLVALTHVPTQSGLVNPAAEVGALTRAADIPFLLDACQSVGQLPIDVDEIGCDLLVTTGRKWLRAPRGTGFLYVRRDLSERLVPPFLDLHAASWTSTEQFTVSDGARRFESWERNVAATLALGTAIREALSWGLVPISERVAELATTLRRSLAAIEGVTVLDRGERLCGIVSFTVAGVAPVDVQGSLGTAGVNVSVTSAGSARYDLDRRGIDSLVRASPHYYNTETEISRLVSIVAEIRAAAAR